MSNFYYELDVESVLQCPVCYELPPNVIFLCKVGHHMCEKCRKRLTVCPTCQSPLTGSRNFLAEALVSKFAIFKGGGDAPNNNIVPEIGVDEMTLFTKQLTENKNTLKPLPLAAGTYKCLLESCRNRKEMGVGHLFTHLDSAHTHLYEKFQNTSATFTHKFEDFCFMKTKRKYHRAFHVSNMGLFFLNLEVLEDSYINCWLSIPAPVKKSNNFDYEIEFSKEDPNKKLRFVSKIASNIQSTQWLLERRRVFVVCPEEHDLKEDSFFSLFVKIVYKSPSN